MGRKDTVVTHLGYVNRKENPDLVNVAYKCSNGKWACTELLRTDLEELDKSRQDQRGEIELHL